MHATDSINKHSYNKPISEGIPVSGDYSGKEKEETLYSDDN